MGDRRVAITHCRCSVTRFTGSDVLFHSVGFHMPLACARHLLDKYEFVASHARTTHQSLIAEAIKLTMQNDEFVFGFCLTTSQNRLRMLSGGFSFISRSRTCLGGHAYLN